MFKIRPKYNYLEYWIINKYYKKVNLIYQFKRHPMLIQLIDVKGLNDRILDEFDYKENSKIYFLFLRF